MSVADYTCAHMNCQRPAVAVRIVQPCSFFGECDEHLRPLEDGDAWLHAPRVSILTYVQAARIRAAMLMDKATAVDVNSPRSHYQRGAYEALREVEQALRSGNLHFE